MDQLGVTEFLRKNDLSGMTTINDYARSLLEDRKLFDEYSQEANNEEDDDNGNEEDSYGDEEVHEEMDSWWG